MKCKKCGKEGCKYINRGNETYKSGTKERTRLVKLNNIARCKKCGWQGEI